MKYGIRYEKRNGLLENKGACQYFLESLYIFDTCIMVSLEF